jgi:hypothetical protein
MSRNKRVKTAEEIRQQAPVDLAAMMREPLNPADKRLPRSVGCLLGFFPKPKRVDPQELAKLEYTRLFGGFLPVRAEGSNATEIRATLTEPTHRWNQPISPEAVQPQTKNPEEPISGPSQNNGNKDETKRPPNISPNGD